MKYRNNDRTFSTSVFIYRDSNGIWNAWTTLEKKQEDAREKKEGEPVIEYVEEQVTFLIPSWKVANKVSSLYAQRNFLGLNMINNKTATETILRYYWKKGVTDLEFDKDDDNIEMISQKTWDEITGEDGLSAHVVFALMRAYNEVSTL